MVYPFNRPHLVLAAAALLAAAGTASAAQWKLSYFYDQDRSSLTIDDLKFPSASRAVAVGGITEKNGKVKPVCLMSGDGGAKWTVEELKQPAISLFFLDDSLGWMVSRKDIWETDEGGRSWRKIPHSPDGMLQVWFVNPRHGWAAGREKEIYETTDGGKRWNKVAAAEEPKTTRKYTVYDLIAFANPQVGMISGWSRPPRRSDEDRLPDWMDPESAVIRRDMPHIAISLDTRDGGAHWKVSTSSIFGRTARVSFGAQGKSLALIEYEAGFFYPSEVFAFDWRSGGPERVFRERNVAVTDVLMMPSGTAYLAAVDVPGRLAHSPIPQRVRILTSKDLKVWKDMPVDYRASATEVTMAAAPDGSVLAATDTGMILKLAP